ncbi:hypothetical protein MHB44_09645 [Lysinibacillus sp. FSL H8-0500]|uniref:hypothetical protein n=1 Tax=Lysinibacillus sp. FSL H8-0500 TaxID=2921393 RepID=UPI003100D04F
MLLLWSMSFVVAIFALVLAVVKFSWMFMLISAITSIPVAAYFLGANNAWQSLGFTPLFLLMLTMAFWFLEKRVIIWRDLK